MHFAGGRVVVEYTVGGPVVSVYRYEQDEPIAVVSVGPDEQLPDGPNDPDYPDMMEEGDK
jgi:hypothetical protein